MDARIKKLFNEYEKAFSALDFKKSAEFFADAFMSAGPKGVIAEDKHEFVKLAAKATEFYKSVGQESARIMGMKETAISDQYSLVTVHWGVKFSKTGDKPVEFRDRRRVTGDPFRLLRHRIYGHDGSRPGRRDSGAAACFAHQ